MAKKKNVDRRGFLKGAATGAAVGAATGALGAALVVPVPTAGLAAGRVATFAGAAGLPFQ